MGIWRDFLDPQNKGSNISGENFGAFFVRKFVPPKFFFRAKTRSADVPP